MRKLWVRYISATLSIALLSMLFAPAIVGAQKSDAYNKEVEELANALEFVFEEATLYDENGNIVGLDVEMLEAEFGESYE